MMLLGASLPSSTVCRYEHFQTDWYKRFFERLRLSGPDQRKSWEFAAVCAALEERDMLRPGRTGLGFAVGREPLASYFASCGVSVLATDLVGVRSESNAPVAVRDAIHHPFLVDNAAFEERVAFRSADMRKLDDDLGIGSYDFIWSCSGMEQLGGLQKGLDFVRESTRFLKPGGIAVHTTEYNVSSNTRTRSRGGAVIYRRRDLEELDHLLRVDRCGVEPIDFDAGTHAYDLNYDEPPFGLPGRKHIKLKFFGYVFTSALLVIRKG